MTRLGGAHSRGTVDMAGGPGLRPLCRAPSTQHPVGGRMADSWPPGAGPAVTALDVRVSPASPQSHTRGQYSAPH